MERRPEQVGSVQYATSACVNQYSFPVSWRLKNLPPVFPHSHKKRTLISGSFALCVFFVTLLVAEIQPCFHCPHSHKSILARQETPGVFYTSNCFLPL